MSLDGSFFGSSFPHVFMKTFPYAITLPPKVYFYEPKIFGFRIAGKLGSQFHKPVEGSVRYTEEEDSERLISQFKSKFRQEREESKASE